MTHNEASEKEGVLPRLRSNLPCLRSKKLLLVLLVGVGMAMLAAIGCAPRETASSNTATDTGTTEVEPAAFIWSPNSDCSVCHAAQQASSTDSAYTMALHANQACIDCHTDDAALQGVHEGLTIASIAETDALSKTVVAESTCTESNCHARDEIFVQATVNSSALTDVKKNVVNPHALPIFEDRGRGSHASITCGNCHQMHSTENIEETAQDVCKNCHHKGTYETCYTALCHAE